MSLVPLFHAEDSSEPSVLFPSLRLSFLNYRGHMSIIQHFFLLSPKDIQMSLKIISTILIFNFTSFELCPKKRHFYLWAQLNLSTLLGIFPPLIWFYQHFSFTFLSTNMSSQLTPKCYYLFYCVPKPLSLGSPLLFLRLISIPCGLVFPF